jgi:hypothetical protein
MHDMKQLPDLPLEMKALATATLIYGGIAVVVGLTYIVASHQGVGGYTISVSDIAALYTGPGISMATIISLAHIHLLGLFAVFTIIGFVFVHSTVSPIWKIFWSVLPYVAFLVDVSGWFLTKLAGPGYVYLVILGGAGFSMALAAMILMSLFDMWIAPVGSLLGKRAAR